MQTRVRRKHTWLLFVLASAVIVAAVSSWQYIGISIPNASAVTTGSGIGVYWNQAATNICQSINWGELTPGMNKAIVVYLKNERTENVVYSVTTGQWNPVNASKYMVLLSNCSGSRASPGSVLPVTLTLSVSPEIAGISNFGFEVIISGNAYSPAVKSFTVQPTPFSPNGDGVKDTTTLKAAFNVSVNWELQARNSVGVVLRSWTGTGSSLSVVWNGKDRSGNKVPDGTYTFRLSGTDLSGVQFATKSSQATVDIKTPTATGVSVSPTSFNPRISQTTKISYTLSESCYVTLKIYNNAGVLVRTLLNNALQSSGYHGAVWSGKYSSGTIVPRGTYTIKLYIFDKAGNRASPYPIIKTVTVL